LLDIVYVEQNVFFCNFMVLLFVTRAQGIRHVFANHSSNLFKISKDLKKTKGFNIWLCTMHNACYI